MSTVRTDIIQKNTIDGKLNIPKAMQAGIMKIPLNYLPPDKRAALKEIAKKVIKMFQERAQGQRQTGSQGLSPPPPA